MSNPSERAAAPVCPRQPVVLKAHGDERTDPYYWLRERENPEVTAYLEAENEFTKSYMSPTEDLQTRLFEEIKSRVQETDLTPPVRKDDYWYYSRTVEGSQYPIHCRKHGTLEADEVMMLDQNELAGSSEYFALGALDVAPDHTTVAYSTDYNGSEKYTMRFREIERRRDLEDEIEGTYYGTAWASDNRTFFYVRPDAAMRPWQVWRHTLGTPAADDVLVFQEDDDRFFVAVDREKTGRYVTITVGSKITTEVLAMAADDPTSGFAVLEPRRQGIEYSVANHGDRWFILTNDDGAVNFKLVEAPVASPGRENWKDVVSHDPDVRLEGFDVFRDHIALYERGDGLRRIRVMHLVDGRIEVIEQPEEVYVTFGAGNPMFDTTTLRYGYSSLVTPMSIYDYDMNDRTRELIKQQPVLGGYDPSDYETTREWATAPDGERVPISLVHRKGLPRDGSAPALLYGYGSYELSVDPAFSSARLSLLERGFVFAIAHIRGGGEMGRRWYDDGKMLAKTNTFTDFIACAEHLVAEKYTAPTRLVARGGSAGGLLMGVVANLRPDLFRTIVAEVPFLDVVTTILDESLPLTVTEWEEWGNPVVDPDVYSYMKSYSPYDNIEAKDYPNILATGGLNDPRVQYWEPAKWVAKLRATKTDGNALLLKTEMGAGHGGPSGRYDAWKDEAFVLAFIFHTLGIDN